MCGNPAENVERSMESDCQFTSLALLLVNYVILGKLLTPSMPQSFMHNVGIIIKPTLQDGCKDSISYYMQST